MFLYYEVRGLTQDVNLINTCDTFEPLYNIARQRVMDFLDHKSKKEYAERLRTIGEKYTKIDNGRYSMSIDLEAKEFKYKTDDYLLRRKAPTSRKAWDERSES